MEHCVVHPIALLMCATQHTLRALLSTISSCTARDAVPDGMVLSDAPTVRCVMQPLGGTWSAVGDTCSARCRWGWQGPRDTSLLASQGIMVPGGLRVITRVRGSYAPTVHQTCSNMFS
eukprot:1161873-Pelagomonas_calceolata.AAC.12